MNKVIFTICSNNYLAQAKTLGDSIKKTNSDYEFIIFLCDKRNEQIDYSFFKNMSLYFIEELQIHSFDVMKSKYDITELNTAIKPFIFQYIYNNFNADTVFYIDPDVELYDSLNIIEKKLENNIAVLTPHILQPIKENAFPTLENSLMLTGIYNLGFLATKKCQDIDKMLDWWTKRLLVGCYNRRHLGAFVDQLPMTFLPIFFNNVSVLKHYGLNVAHWNLHERTLSRNEGKYIINNKYPLIFFHFSGYSPLKPDIITKRWKNCLLNDEVLKQLHYDYADKMLANKYELFKNYKCAYIRNSWLERKLLYTQSVLLFLMKKIDTIVDYIRTKNL